MLHVLQWDTSGGLNIKQVEQNFVVYFTPLLKWNLSTDVKFLFSISGTDKFIGKAPGSQNWQIIQNSIVLNANNNWKIINSCWCIPISFMTIILLF